METQAAQTPPLRTAPRGALRAVDTWLTRIARWFSYFGGIAMLFMAFMGVANIISSKFFGHAIANTNELIDYALILVVYCAVAQVQLDMGLLKVDIFSRKFPKKVNKGVEFVGCIVGACIYGFAAYEAISLLSDHYRLKTTAAASLHSFVIWPFTVVYVTGTFFLALALLWSVVRMFAFRDEQSGPVPNGAADAAEEVGE